MSLGRGVALRVNSSQLASIRAEVADAFAYALTAQDSAPWRPHVTIQNKVTPEAAKALMDRLAIAFQPRPLAITGLAAWYYREGPWETIGAWRFGGGHKMKPPPPLFPG